MEVWSFLFVQSVRLFRENQFIFTWHASFSKLFSWNSVLTYLGSVFVPRSESLKSCDHWNSSRLPSNTALVLFQTSDFFRNLSKGYERYFLTFSSQRVPVKQQTEVVISLSSPTSDSLGVIGRVPGNCGREILIDNKVRERRERVPVLASVSYTLTTHHSTTPEKHPPFWDLINTWIVCLTLSIHIFSNLPCSWWYPHHKCLCVYVCIH